MSQGHPSSHWPPKSPHEALLSTPGGRDRLRRIAERTSPSPSPSKRPAYSAARSRSKDMSKMDVGLDSQEDEDDEETLQLQLQEIQARLRLKRIQKKQKHESDSENDSRKSGAEARLTSRSSSVATSRTPASMAARRDNLLERPKSQNIVHVPVSPVRRAQPVTEQRSPGRILLGIDKGLKASDISLKRAPSMKRLDGEKLAGPFLQRPTSQTGGLRASPTRGITEGDVPKSFSERMAALRSQEAEKEQRQSRVKQSRSRAFDIDHDQMQGFKAKAIDLPDLPRSTHQYSRDEILNGIDQKPTRTLRNTTLPDLKSAIRSNLSETASSGTSFEKPSSQVSSREAQKREKDGVPVVPAGQVSESEALSFEPYSARHLSKRIIPHQVLTRTLSGKKAYQISDLLRDIKGPDFSLPEIEEDVVVFGIIAKKSEPRAHAPNGKTVTRGKYMVITLTDLKWEVELFLFDSGFDKFWKLTTGTLIAVLNPGVMPPPRGKDATNKFSLTINSEADTVLEIGTARDLGFCTSIKKDGSKCSTWVDKRHTEVCDWHVSETLKRTASKRMEINTMTGYGGRKFNAKDVSGGMERARQKEEEKRTRWDKESHSQIYISKPSTANLLDNVDFDPDPFHRGSSKEQRVMRQVLAQEKERDLAKKLGSFGGGLGADYMKRRNEVAIPSSNTNSETGLPPPPDAAALGLLAGKAADVALGPTKRKRATTASGAAAMGWGSDLSKKLGSMKDGENLQPVKKKTRFITAKGIREAGRESFGGDLPTVTGTSIEDDDDSDDLDIVR